MFGWSGKLGQTENIFSVDRKIRDQGCKTISVLIFTSNNFRLNSLTRTQSNKCSPSSDPHTRLYHLPHAKRSRSSPSRSRSSPRTVSFPFPFLSPIHIAHFSVRSPKFLSLIHPLITSFLIPIHTAPINTPKIQRMKKRTHPQTHKQPNLHPSLISFWNPTP